MTNTTPTTHSGGIGFAGLLTILFVALKLLGYIAWSWWWVLSPLWISSGIAFVFLVLFIILFLVAGDK